MSDWLPMALSFTVALLCSLLLTPLARWLGRRAGWDKRAGSRHIHSRPVPRSGGVALALAMVVALILVLLLPIPRPPGEALRIGLLLIGSLLILALLLWDDIREMRPLPKLVIQFAVATMAILPYFWAPGRHPPPGFLITQVQNPLGDLLHWGDTLYLPLAVAVPFTLFWIVGMMNTVNWLDGLNGLAGGVTAIVALLLFIHTVRLGQYSLAPLPLALLGTCLGFLPYNFAALIFMGDSGAMFLGYALAILSIIGGAKMATALLVLGVPLLDVAWVIVFRLSRGRSPMQADQGHLHHRLLHLGLSQTQIVLIFYGLCAGFGALALLLPSGLYKLCVLVAMALGVSAFLWWLARRQLDRGERGPNL